jgi:hypothetical protein
MGDRANVVVKGNGEQVCLYTHWRGSELPELVRSALIRGKVRDNDYPYLSRIIFSEMIRGEVDGLTGYGITATIQDGEDRVVTVDVDKGTVQLNKGKVRSMAKFVDRERKWSK